MRPFEVILLTSVVLCLVAWPIVRQRHRLLLSIAVYISVALLLVHSVVEGQRWQLWPTYLVAISMFATQLVINIRNRNFSKSLPKRRSIWRLLAIASGLLLTALSAIIASVLPVFNLPEPTGSYQTGATRLHFTDHARPDEYSSTESDYRQIPVRVWYPSSDQWGTKVPYMTSEKTAALAATYELPAFFLNYLSLVETHSMAGAQVADGQFPLVLYSPSGFNVQGTAMCEELASHGFVVAAINHAYWNAYSVDSLGAVTVNDRSNAYLRRMWEEEMSPETESIKDQITRADDNESKLQLHNELTLAMPTEVQDIKEWSKDISFIIDQLETHPDSPDGLTTELDFDRIAVIGFSKGGAAAGQACLDDQRISAGVNLDGFMFGDVVDSAIPCPFLFAHSEPFVPDAYINDVFYERSPDGSVLMKVHGAKHANFSDMSLWGPLMTAQDNFGSIEGHRVVEIINSYVLAFLNSSLNGSVESLLSCPKKEYSEVELFKKIGSSSIQIVPLAGSYLGQEPPGLEPELFAPGIIPVDGIQHCIPTFSPDGNEVYWMSGEFLKGKFKGTIWYTKMEQGLWIEPRIAPFSGEYNDHAPFMTADGTRLYFSSSRPGGVDNVQNVWYVDRTDEGWSDPVNLGSPPNTELGATQATFTTDGTMYFVASKEGTQWNTGIYRSRIESGAYQEPELLPPPISTEYADVYPFIAPDESYLLFGSTRPGGRSTETDLYISYRESNDTWSEPSQLGESVNNGKTVSFSSVTHDGKYLFFNRFDEDGTDKFYWVDASTLNKYQATNIPASSFLKTESRLHQELDMVLDSSRRALDIIGVSAAVVWENGRTWTGVSGISTPEQPVTDDMLFGIGSATKTYVAALVLKYVEDGLLSLDDPVTNWLTDLPVELTGVSIRQLLNHTSGLYNYMAHPDYNSALFAHPDTMWNAEILLSSFMLESYGAPGEAWHYSAANYILLGILIEKLTGNDAHNEIQDKLLRPLNLRDTYLYPQQVYNTDRMAHLWMAIDSTGVPMDINALVGYPPHRGMFSSVWTAGAIHATALDAAI